ncbi:NAD(P)/FAD-dependent oxidoreductase [Roseateles albus]|uniref:FAD-dependent oxidoreductase n=1 Tax=Roseateles albus TaxID=2987525 RepID=A0ABT5KC11_9BURK|nr:FAD-dependent oxidoreductase [Roseateles albus]MDC8771474.1 FAD-dependent oxidoreductase [Roseateles albus]
MPSAQHVAVIGAGLAGLSCATALQAVGHRVTVFDKSRGVAGRMSTRRGEGWACDHGAQYFTARDSAFVAELARWRQAGVAAVWSPRLAVFGEAGQHRQDGALQRFVGTPHMTAPAQWLAGNLAQAVRLGQPIEAILPAAKGWRLQSGGAALDDVFDAVLLALPAPQAAALLQGCAPELAHQAAAVRMRASWAVMLTYEQALDLGFDAGFVNAGPLRWLARNSSKPGRMGAESWLLHARAEWSEANLQTPPEQVAAELQQAFKALGGVVSERWTAHRWLYADIAPNPTGVAEPGSAGPAIWDARLSLGLCGDWLGGGKVEGAWLSGQAAARRVIAGV